MAFPIRSLPIEITEEILLLLSAEDILNLGKCMPLRITREVYNNSFPDGTRFSHYDMKMFEERAHAKLYVIGDIGEQRLFSKNPDAHFEFVGDQRRMCTPWKVDTEGSIARVCIGCEHFHVLNTAGRVFDYHTYPVAPEDMKKMPFKPYLQEPRTGFEDDYAVGRGKMIDNKRYVRMPKLSRVSEELFRKPLKPTNFLCLDASNFVVLAGDDNGLVWRWMSDWDEEAPAFGSYEDDDDRWGENGAQAICLVEKGTGRVLRGPILNIKTGSMFCDYGTCLVGGEGVYKWDVMKMMEVRSNGVRGGYQCFDDRLCHIVVEKVPIPPQYVHDYVFLNMAIAYLKPDGTIVGVSLGERYDGYGEYINGVNRYGPFVGVNAFNSTLTLTKNDGTVLNVFSGARYVGNDDHRELLVFPEVRGKLPNMALSAVAPGMTHTLALTEGGEVYVWGSETCCNGCMAMGKLKDAIKQHGVRFKKKEDGDFELFVEKPTKIKLPGKVCAVWADQDYSAMLVCE